MPDISNIDSEKILSTASQLDGIIDRMGGCVSKFNDAISALDKGWVSEVKAAFMADYQVDREALAEMFGQLREISESLRVAAADFDKTEGDIATGVKALR